MYNITLTKIKKNAEKVLLVVICYRDNECWHNLYCKLNSSINVSVTVTNISSYPMYKTTGAYIERCCLLLCKRNAADLHNLDITTARHNEQCLDRP